MFVIQDVTLSANDVSGRTEETSVWLHLDTKLSMEDVFVSSIFFPIYLTLICNFDVDKWVSPTWSHGFKFNVIGKQSDVPDQMDVKSIFTLMHKAVKFRCLCIDTFFTIIVYCLKIEIFAKFFSNLTCHDFSIYKSTYKTNSLLSETRTVSLADLGGVERTELKFFPRNFQL